MKIILFYFAILPLTTCIYLLVATDLPLCSIRMLLILFYTFACYLIFLYMCSFNMQQKFSKCVLLFVQQAVFQWKTTIVSVWLFELV